MNGTKTVLNAVHKGTQMGLRSLDNIMDTVEDAKMRAHLREEHAQYAEIHKRAAALRKNPIPSGRWQRWRPICRPK